MMGPLDWIFVEIQLKKDLVLLILGPGIHNNIKFIW